MREPEDGEGAEEPSGAPGESGPSGPRYLLRCHRLALDFGAPAARRALQRGLRRPLLRLVRGGLEH